MDLFFSQRMPMFMECLKYLKYLECLKCLEYIKCQMLMGGAGQISKKCLLRITLKLLKNAIFVNSKKYQHEKFNHHHLRCRI